ncbi:MAG: hypothetical protein JSV99_11800 [Planctomycetota bacterium]|nr:MAG: hypothetical protein JSV99_11800 [Planctomycetota bacterium]
MKKLLLILLFFSTASVAVAQVSVRVCMADGNTPLELADPCVPLVYRPIMAGTQLTLIVYSNDPEAIPNGIDLAIADANRDYGVLACRDENGIECQGSILPPAGPNALVYTWVESGIAGYSLYRGVKDVEAGDWFIIDYNATAVGSCKVAYYDHDISMSEPNYYLEFTHVPTRDLNNDGIVNFVDFNLFASYWQATDCTEPSWCQGTDIDNTGSVDGNDLGLFVDFWVERTNLSWF